MQLKKTTYEMEQRAKAPDCKQTETNWISLCQTVDSNGLNDDDEVNDVLLYCHVESINANKVGLKN